ncbi:peptide chain release factor PrfB3, chloroplastic [Tanacetum coccineum]
MAAETVAAAAASSHIHKNHYSSWATRISNKRRLLTPSAAAQPMDIHTSKSYKQLGMFSLRKKIEDSVNRAEMLGLSALEFEEARRVKQEEMVREYDLWDDLAKSSDILIKLADSAKVVDALKDLTYKVEEAKLITELAEMDIINYALLKQAYTASVDVSKFLDKYEMSKLLKGKYEFEGACIIIEAGPEGMRSEIWAEQLVGMYMKWAKKQGLKGRIVEKKCMPKPRGISSVIIEFEQKYAYGYFLGEKGTHRMITSHPESLSEVSSASVDVVPLFLEETRELFVDEKDLKINYLSLHEDDRGRKGTMVQIQHAPTGLTVHSSGERNQFSNKMKALNRLKAKLLVILKDQNVTNITEIKNDAVIDPWHQETRSKVTSLKISHYEVHSRTVDLPKSNSYLKQSEKASWAQEKLNPFHASGLPFAIFFPNIS